MVKILPSSEMDEVFDALVECLTADTARRITEIRLPPTVQSRIDELAAKANEGMLTDQERQQYDEYINAIDLLAIVKAKARRSLKGANGDSPTELNLVVIRAADVEAAQRFYACLGLDLRLERHESGPEHYAAQLGAAVFEIYPRRGDVSANGLRIGFQVASLDAVVAALQRISARIVTKPHDSPWGRRAVVEDPDGHRVELTERQ